MKTTKVRRLGVGLLFPLVLCACAEGRGDVEWAGSVDTLAGGVVHVRNPPEPLWTPGEEWALEEELRIGSATEEGPELFGQVRDLAVDPLGRIYVLENPTRSGFSMPTAGTYERSPARGRALES